MLDITCPQCHALYHSDEVHIGRNLRCRICGSAVPILAATRSVVQSPPGIVCRPRGVGTHASRPSRRRGIFVLAVCLTVAMAVVWALWVRRPSVAGPVETGTKSPITIPSPPVGFTLDRDPSGGNTSQTREQEPKA